MFSDTVGHSECSLHLQKVLLLGSGEKAFYSPDFDGITAGQGHGENKHLLPWSNGHELRVPRSVLSTSTHYYMVLWRLLIRAHWRKRMKRKGPSVKSYLGFLLMWVSTSCLAPRYALKSTK